MLCSYSDNILLFYVPESSPLVTNFYAGFFIIYVSCIFNFTKKHFSTVMEDACLFHRGCFLRYQDINTFLVLLFLFQWFKTFKGILRTKKL